MPTERLKKYWRLYRTRAGNRIIRDDINALDQITYAELKAAMDEVVEIGLSASKRIRGDIRQIYADGPDGTTYRLLFAVDGSFGQILLALVLFEKRTQETPDRWIDLADKRLKDWRDRRKEAEDKEKADAKAARRGGCRT